MQHSTHKHDKETTIDFGIPSRRSTGAHAAPFTARAQLRPASGEHSWNRGCAEVFALAVTATSGGPSDPCRRSGLKVLPEGGGAEEREVNTSTKNQADGRPRQAGVASSLITLFPFYREAAQRRPDGSWEPGFSLNLTVSRKGELISNETETGGVSCDERDVRQRKGRICRTIKLF